MYLFISIIIFKSISISTVLFCLGTVFAPLTLSFTILFTYLMLQKGLPYS